MTAIKNGTTLRALAIFIIVTILLTPGFYRNEWQTAGKKRFSEWRMNSSHMLVGRLAHSKQSGVFADSALLGTVDGGWPTPPGIAEHQYDVYVNQLHYDSFFAYRSAIGLQGILFSLFDKHTNYPENFNLKIFSGFTSVLSAMMMATLIMWFFLQFGFLSAIFAAGFILLSKWMTFFGGDIYWQLWAFYLPTVIVFYYCARKEPANQVDLHLLSLIFVTVLIKILFNAFEFISTALLMIYTPLLYFAILQGWSYKKFFALSIKIGISAILATLTGLGILLIQLAGIMGGLTPAVEYVQSTLMRRTYGDVNLYPVEAEGLQASISSVIWIYISGRAFNLQFLQDTPWLSSFGNISYLSVFVVFIITSAIFLGLYFHKSKIFGRKPLALFCSMWFSAVSPLSWFILFKGHSYIHTHLNYIVWQMPFTIVGFAFLGYFLQNVALTAKAKIYRRAQ
jgi:hypothetical protein